MVKERSMSSAIPESYLLVIVHVTLVHCARQVQQKQKHFLPLDSCLTHETNFS